MLTPLLTRLPLALLLGLAGCAGRAGARSGLELGEVTLGWRLVPGMELTYACTTTYTQDQQRVEELARVEHWSYLVRDLDETGVASLEGRLTAFGAGLTVDGLEVGADQLAEGEAEEVERLSALTVELALAMDGRAQVTTGSWADRLPHRQLGLTLPEIPVSVGDAWPDPSAARPYADLLPMGLELEISATSRLEDVVLRDGLTQAKIVTEGYVRPSDTSQAGGVFLDGAAWWDLRSGRLIERTLTLTLSDAEEAERLDIALRLIE